MKNLEILSTQQFPSELAEEWVTQPAHDVQLVFDACHVGVVLRAVLFVQAMVAVGLTVGWTLRRVGVKMGEPSPARRCPLTMFPAIAAAGRSCIPSSPSSRSALLALAQ